MQNLYHAKPAQKTNKRLEQYLSVVRSTEKRLETIAASSHDIPKATMERPLAPANLNDQVESMLDLISLALWTDSTRCVSYMLGNSNSRMIFDFLGIKEQHHYLSHFFETSHDKTWTHCSRSAYGIWRNLTICLHA